jgi:hypothetical protein
LPYDANSATVSALISEVDQTWSSDIRRESKLEDVILIPREKFRAAGRKRWKGIEKKERSRILSAAGKATWADFTSKERSVEMKRRAAVRKRNRARKK